MLKDQEENHETSTTVSNKKINDNKMVSKKKSEDKSPDLNQSNSKIKSIMANKHKKSESDDSSDSDQDSDS